VHPRQNPGYAYVWAPDNGSLSFPCYNNLRWGNAFSHKLDVGERRSLASHYTLTIAAALNYDRTKPKK